MIIRTESDGETVIAVGDNCHDLARILGITPQAVSHGIHRGSRLYHVVPDDDEGDGDPVAQERYDERASDEEEVLDAVGAPGEVAEVELE